MRRLPTVPPTAVVITIVMAGLVAALLSFFILPGLLVSDSEFTTNVDPPSTATPAERSTINAEQAAIEERRLKARSDVRWVAVQLIGAVALLVGGAFTWRTVWMTRQGQLSDRFATAVTQLREGTKQPGVRVAAIYTLGDIARDSRAQHPTVMALLASHLRAISPCAEDTKQVRPDVQAVADVLKQRRPHWDRGALKLRDIDLRYAPLEQVDLRGAELERCDLRHARLVRADLRGARLAGARLDNASLQHAKLDDADLTGASLRYASFSDASLKGADLEDVLCAATHLDGANLEKAHVPGDLSVSGLVIQNDATRWP
jgi:hypothetical protein